MLRWHNFIKIILLKLTVMSNQDKKKVDDDEFFRNLDTEFPLSGGETDDDDTDENEQDNDEDEKEEDDEDEKEDEEFKHQLDTEFPLSGGETEL